MRFRKDIKIGDLIRKNGSGWYVPLCALDLSEKFPFPVMYAGNNKLISNLKLI